MRYQNWDVLLFPGDSRTPIQEFNTKCFVLRQNVDISSSDATVEKYPNNFESMTLVPILTSFIASLERGAAFRISIHSWDKPTPSHLLLSYKTPEEAILFEARVYIDGVLVAQRAFDENVWPEVIGMKNIPTLTQTYLANGAQPGWDHSELMGRIRVVISEGVVRDNTPPAASATRFDRLRDVVAFSFQHAPQDILEYSGIAWPSFKMFQKLPSKPSRPGPIGSRVSGISGHEAHSHSPQRLPPIASRSKRLSTNENYQNLLESQKHSEAQLDSVRKVPNVGVLKSQSPESQIPIKLMAQDDDPFTSSHQTPTAIQQWRLQLRSTSHDVSMPDYASSKTDRSVVNTEMSGVSVPRANFLKHMNEANPEEILQALSPARQEQLFKALSASHSPVAGTGTQPPANTPRTTNNFNTPRVMHSGGANAAATARIWQEPRQRRRTCSLASSRSTSEPVAQLIKEQTSPRLPRGPKIGLEWLKAQAVLNLSGIELGLREPWKKYRKFKPLDLPNRQWPSRTNDKPPRWLATDLRDGNQSLVDPMDGEQKLRFFKMLVELGYKEIEVSFPSASQTDYDFTRYLIETPGVVPDDVWVQVLSPCREDFIRRTVESVRGAKKAILHLYLATSECFRRIVFGMTEDETLALAVKCTKFARSITKDDPSHAGTEWLYEFSPETFSDTSPEFAVRVCEAVKEAWGPTEDSKLIFNLPATVEMATPNIFADQIEYFCTHMTEREKFCVSVHPHNDRGCAVAAAELAQMAGAERVEGTLFGNGERTGNVDLVTLALNLYTQGVWPNVDFSDINKVIRVCEESTKIPVNERWPYGGQLVVCAFSGSHQDAIKKGFQLRKKEGRGAEDPWELPYLPLDPQDIGRTYEAVIRVNSQSGKGGVAWIIQRSLELDLPRGLQIAFSKIVQKEADAKGRELLPREIQALFEESYHLKKNPRFTLIDYNITAVRTPSPAPQTKISAGQPPQTAAPAQNTSTAKRQFAGIIAIDGVQHPIVGVGNGAISSLANALHSLGIDLDVADYKEHAIGEGREVKAATYIECTASNSNEKVWGVGIHEDVVQASLIALLSAASSFLTSRVSTPVPFKPKHLRQFSEAELEALERLNLNNGSDGPNSPLRSSVTATEGGVTPSKLNKETNPSSVAAKKIDIDLLEQKAESVNGHVAES
ncbi:2-isopropylmalate synthase [Fonsecaea nubica]|uniref:2-isopropylmalate synthase n=1 Tax=Fonsecaea nubica TaxID=856822 RepID=A0A178DEG3_9EURO|nr:2-isopropylmalate synthase [Fonsecaea nubica]OAL40166.1 2-isopropylmalate synthase [Fonsecaea nubica]